MKTSAPVFQQTLALESVLPHVRRTDARGAGSVLYTAGKRLLDVTLSGAALLLLGPVLLVIALWVRLDSRGPSFYSQTRLGKDGAEFRLFKFRTMAVSAENESGPVWASVNDSRVTRAGALLRKIYLDELPQLWNILKGEMSFVGPRPERPFFSALLERSIPGFSARCAVKPGLTGLAQVRQSHEASLRAVRRKLRYDRLYIRRRSLGLDLYLIWRTLRLVLDELKEAMR